MSVSVYIESHFCSIFFVCPGLQVWSHKDFPLIDVGTMTLNRNPVDYFTEVEQIAFSPSHMVPGVEPSPDKMLQVSQESLKTCCRGLLPPF